MENYFDLQTIILKLQQFWADQGCLIWQPYNVQVGAGTMNPATFLRVLGPEPWNVAYVEPSVRPDDGRYGENPYRFQQHYQFQVILKPDPGNPQELYLDSLKAIGIDPHKHDIRFVEDNWESPALGAWGLGWEVWLDGQEITQFTYFQQAGGFVLDPVSVEITYGLERIAMPLQGKYHFRSLRWNQEFTDGEINFQAEAEHSKYYFELADVDRLRKMYDLYEKEANLALANGLVLPAHDYILKCSHTFNILDTRGAVGVTERQALFSRMRELAHQVAGLYLQQRESMGFPWLKKNISLKSSSRISKEKSTLKSSKQVGEKETLLFEIGTEELPAGDLASAVEQLHHAVPALLEEQRLTHGEIKIYATPRRLVVFASEVASRQSDSLQVIKGPPVSRGLDAKGQFTLAAEGFARGKGIPVESLVKRTMHNGDYLVAEINLKGKSAEEIFVLELPKLIAAIRFTKAMRWNSSNIAFARPIRWLLALYGQVVIPFEYAGIISSNLTRGLRFHQPEIKEINSVEEYLNYMESQGIQLDPLHRISVIASQVNKLQKDVSADTLLDQELLAEVNNLVEAPVALMGSFAEEHLKLPIEVLVSVMKKHQRYFPLIKPDGKLMPRFITIRNGNHEHMDSVTFGNEQVIQARFADANFFISQDIQHKLEEYVPRLSTLTFHLKLGSMLEKTQRIENITRKLLSALNLDYIDEKTTMRAAMLCKADLVTHMVTEMTSLQGVMGHYYAIRSDEGEEVGQAIEEHYYPRFSGDRSPNSTPGLVIGLADRLDSLAGLFAVGNAPNGNKDPFGLRRTAIGLVQNLINADIQFDLRQGLEFAAEALQGVVNFTIDQQKDCLAFIIDRLETLLREQGYAYDIVAAILAEQGSIPARAVNAIRQLTTWVAKEDWKIILPAYARCVRITRDLKNTIDFHQEILTEPAEKELANKLLQAQAVQRKPGDVDDFFRAFTPLIPSINQFFDNVMVMVEDEKIRQNRLALLKSISVLASGVADFSKMEGF